jgi:hypothetical protein
VTTTAMGRMMMKRGGTGITDDHAGDQKGVIASIHSCCAITMSNYNSNYHAPDVIVTTADGMP